MEREGDRQEDGPMDLVRHMIVVIENQQAQIAQLREENATLRARLPTVVASAPASNVRAHVAECGVAAVREHGDAVGVAEEGPGEGEHTADEAARITDDALASLIDLANARTHVGAAPRNADAPLSLKRPLQAGAAGNGALVRQVFARLVPAHVVLPVDSAPFVAAQPVLARPACGMAEGDDGGARAEPTGDERRCIVCGTRDTPKWRAGNQLCNACGLRSAKQVRSTACSRAERPLPRPRPPLSLSLFMTRPGAAAWPLARALSNARAARALRPCRVPPRFSQAVAHRASPALSAGASHASPVAPASAAALVQLGASRPHATAAGAPQPAVSPGSPPQVKVFAHPVGSAGPGVGPDGAPPPAALAGAHVLTSAQI